MPNERPLSNRADGLLDGSSIAQEQARKAQLRGISTFARVTGSGASPDQETATQSIFLIELSNTGAADKVIALHAGALATVGDIATLTGVTVDAIAVNGVVIPAAVSCTTKANTLISHFQKYVNSNPTRIIRIKAESNEDDQMAEAIILKKISPVKSLGSQELFPSNYKRQSDLQTKLVIMDLVNGEQLDDQTVMYVNLLAGRTLSLTLFLGASINTAANLEQMMARIK